MSSTQKIKRMNVRTFNGDKDEQFLREKLIKKLGYTVSWQTT